ncbi:hypothetical protein ACJMK2_016949 [Sinanodonta woodiana]|uniref:Heme-binding protein 2 n=1 Tax=Sinanodonta woodiana TaxID=1069815 RepID=A0ABD3UVC8_SINWO
MSIFRTIQQAVTGGGINKPVYNVKMSDNNTQVEERNYESAMWVSTTVQGMDYEKAVTTGFWRLFKYIGGENDQGCKIEMTAPVATKIIPGAGPNCENTFIVSFYVPPEHQMNPPVPTSPDVNLQRFPEMTVFTKSFGGFAKEATWLAEARNLGEILMGKEKFHQDFYFTAGYDSPFKLFGRRNEVWFVKDP